MADQVFLRGEGGVVTAYDLPLHWAIEKRLVKGYLTRVADADGTQLDRSVELDALSDQVPGLPTERPSVEDRMPAWVGWAVAESARRGEPISADDAEASTKQDLIERYGTEPAAPIEAPPEVEEPPVEIIGEPVTEDEAATLPPGEVTLPDGTTTDVLPVAE